jgi:hypothetical protein
VPVADVEDQIERYYQTVKLDEATADTLYGHIIKTAKKRSAKALKLAQQQRKRIEILESERRSLLKAHLAGAVPLELLAEEQNRITDELAQAGALMANSEVHWEELERNLHRALALASNLGPTYTRANQMVRRQMNQAIFEEILVEVDGRSSTHGWRSHSPPSTTKSSAVGQRRALRTPGHRWPGVRTLPLWFGWWWWCLEKPTAPNDRRSAHLPGVRRHFHWAPRPPLTTLAVRMAVCAGMPIRARLGAT